MTSLQSSTMSEADTIDDFVVADSSAAATGDTFEEAAATEEGSAQPEGLRSAESPLPPGDPPGMKGPPDIDVKEEAKEDGSTVEPDGSTVARAGVTNMTLPNGSTEDTVMRSLTEELEQQKKNFELDRQALAKQAQDLQEALAKADEEKRQAHARAVAAEVTAARLHADQAADQLAAHARAATAEAASGQVDLSPEPDLPGDENMQHADQATRHKMDHATRSEGCQWCASTWEGPCIDLCEPEWAAIIWTASFKNASEITTFNKDGVTPDWESTATSGEGIAIDPKKFQKC